jgi:hypothetical protein
MPALIDTKYSRIVAALAIVYVLFLYSGASDFLANRMGEVGVSIARFFIYGFFALALVLAPLVLLKYRPAGLGRWDLAFACYAAALFGVMCYHLIATPQEGGVVTKSFITAVLHIWTFGLLFSTTSAARATQLTTVMVVLACGLFILVEVAVPSLAELPGRGSGFYLNPNVAALALLLGSLGALPSLAPLWRLPFLAFVGVVVFATLSRSGIIAAAATWAAWLVAEWRPMRDASRDYIRGASIAVVVVAAGGLFLTLAASKQFRDFTGKAAGPLIADNLVPAAPAERPSPRRDPLGPTESSPAPGQEARVASPIDLPETAAGSRCESWTVIFDGLSKADACAWLRQERVERVQKHSSGEARAVLALRSVAAFMDSPLVGVGLEKAHDLHTHNAFLFFGIAYGLLGILLIPAFALVLACRLGEVQRALPFIAFLVFSSFFSHDIFLTHGLIAAWVIALSAGPPGIPASRSWT